MDAHSPDTGSSGRLVSRRKVLAGGAVAGAALWVAPTIESFTSSAAAQSAAPGSCTTGTKGLQYLSLLLCVPDRTTKTYTAYYRCKFDLSDCTTKPGTKITVNWNQCGYDFTNQPCYDQQHTDPTCTPGQSQISPNGPQQVTGEYCIDSHGNPYLVVTNGDEVDYTLGAYVANHDVTCAYGQGDQLTCTPASYDGPTVTSWDWNNWPSIGSHGGCATFPAVH